MKLSMFNWMRAEPVEATAARLARCGYQAIQISGEPAVYDAAEVKELLDRHGIGCSGSVTMMEGGRDLINEDRYVRLGSIQYVKDCLSFTSHLGGNNLTVIPSTFGKLAPMASPTVEWRWALEGLQECEEHAQRVGVRMAIEPLNRFETYFINRHDQALELAEDVGGTCGVALDFFQMNIEETSWEAALRASADRLVEVHVADTNRRPPGRGALDWTLALSVLNDIGYDGYLVVEIEIATNRTPLGWRAGIDTDSDEYYEHCVRECADHLRSVEDQLQPVTP